MIHPQLLSAIDPVKSIDPIQQAGKLADLQNTQQAGVLQGQQIAAGADAAKSRQSEMQADQDAIRIMQTVKFDKDGGLDPATEQALAQNGSKRAQAILTQFSTIAQKKSIEALQAAQVDNLAKDNLRGDKTLEETLRHNQEDENIKRSAPTKLTPGETLLTPGQEPYTAPAAAAKPDTNTTPFEAWQKQNPGAPVSDFLKLEGQNRASNVGLGATASDPKDIAQAIIDGKQQPVLTGLYRDAAPVRAELARRGYDLATATTDWNATQKYLGTLNGTQQTRLRQAISFTSETLPQVEAAYAEWKKQAGISGFKVLNKANLAAMKQLPGAAGAAAHQLDSLIADFTSELGTVYKGGNSSTDESLKLAAQNLQSDWNDKTFGDAIKRLNTSLTIRRNSMATGPAGGIGGEYSPQGAAAPAPQAGSPKVGDTKKFPNGKTGQWDGHGWVAQ